MQASALEQRKITIKKEYDTNLPSLTIDKSRLIQVVVNIIKNSYESFDEMEKINRVNCITIRTFSKNKKAFVEITDNGIGFDLKDINSFFEFGKSNKGSSGFGLYYCKMFMIKNNGELFFTSPGIGKGATLKLSFNI